MRDDQVADAEKIRDYGMYVAYSTFSYCKNRYSKKEDWTCTHLVWVSHVSGKRESRRVVGDYILREQDLTRPIRHEDETCTTTWRIDQHYPMEKNSQQYPGAEWLSEGVLTPIDFYALPYRCFYSKDVRNMFMAGRNISVTHIALGSTRVMRTCGMIGEVVGMAASVCMSAMRSRATSIRPISPTCRNSCARGRDAPTFPTPSSITRWTVRAIRPKTGSGLPACGMTPHAGGSHPSARRLAAHPEPTY